MLICVLETGSRHVLDECVNESCAFALCPCCYVFWYVAKGRGQAESRTSGAQSGRTVAEKSSRAKGQQL